MTVFLLSDSDDNFMIPSRSIDRVDRSYLLCEFVVMSNASGNPSLSLNNIIHNGRHSGSSHSPGCLHTGP